MGLARLLSTVERHAPGVAHHLKIWFVERGVPLNRSIGLRVEEVAPDSSRVVLRLPPRRRNQNDGGTVHGGVITAFAETVHGVAVLWQFQPARHRMVTRSLRVEFLAPARGTLWVEYRLEEAVRRGIEGRWRDQRGPAESSVCPLAPAGVGLTGALTATSPSGGTSRSP
jgi:uncharacterized protein (TIGR00369 family)